MLTVWAVCVGTEFKDDEVRILKRQVERHAPPHEFVCITDHEIAEVDCLIPPDIGDYPGWWAKLLIFRHGRSSNLFLDLDSVVVGDIGSLVSEKLSMPRNWSLHRGPEGQSGVMSWAGSFDITKHYSKDRLCGHPAYPDKPWAMLDELWGDMGYIGRYIGTHDSGAIAVMNNVYSYKYHCQSGYPAGAAVVAFHGLPRPADVDDKWVINARKYPR